MTAPRARIRTLPTAPAAPPGALDTLIVEAITAARPLSDDHRRIVAIRHQADPDGRSCRGCAYRYKRRDSNACPSRIFLDRGLPAALAAVPSETTTRPCRYCRGPVTVAAGTHKTDRPVCDCCENQDDLFGGDGEPMP